MVEDPEEQKDAGVTSVAFSPDGYFLVAGALDKAIRIWDVNTGDLLKTIPEAHSDSVYSVGFSPDGLSLISGGLDRSVNLWRFDPSDKFLVKGEELAGHKDFVLATSFLGDSGYAVSGSKDRQLLIWKTRSTASRNSSGEKPTLVCWFQAHKNSIITMAIPSSPQAMVFATGSGDKKAKIWRYHYLPKSPKNLTIDKRMKLEDSEV